MQQLITEVFHFELLIEHFVYSLLQYQWWLPGAFYFGQHCKYHNTSCFLILYPCLWLLPKLVIIPRSWGWQNNQLHKMIEIRDVWLNYFQLSSRFHIIMIIDSILYLILVHSRSSPKFALIESVLGNLTGIENGHNVFTLLYLWPFLLIQWKGVFADMDACI